MTTTHQQANPPQGNGWILIIGALLLFMFMGGGDKSDEKKKPEIPTDDLLAVLLEELAGQLEVDGAPDTKERRFEFLADLGKYVAQMAARVFLKRAFTAEEKSKINALGAELEALNNDAKSRKLDSVTRGRAIGVIRDFVKRLRSE
tara:strand:- start:2411 stop:2848 length:438 start_codon:yes stop_codon:yes gene_type:complete